MALMIGRLFPRRASCSDLRSHRVQGFCIYLLTILANIVHTESNTVTTSMQLEYTTIIIPSSTMEILVPFTSIPTPSSSSLSSSSSSSSSLSSLVGFSVDLAPSTALYPSPSPSGISQMWTSDFTVYTAFNSASEMTSELMSTLITPSMISSLTSPLSSTLLSSQSSVMVEASQTLRATSSVVSTEEMLGTFELGNSSPTMSQNLSPLTSSVESSSSPPPSSLGASFIMSTPTVLMPSSVSMPTTSKSPSSSSSSSSLFSSSFPLSSEASQSSISLIYESSSGAAFTTTQSLSPTPIIPTPSPTMDTSTQPLLTTAGPDQLSILEWFGIAVGGAAVLFILFLMFHCYQLRQRTIRKQKKEMKKEILDFSQSNRNDRISSWRNSLALDAMAMHIELPQEDSMDMQSLDNLGFEEVFLGDGPKSSSNNNYFLPQTNL